MSTIRRRSKKNAFTLIELLLVLVILAVLATIVAMNFNSIFGQAYDTKVKTDIQVLDSAIETYRAQVGTFPPTLDALVTNPGDANWHGPYLKRGVPKDPWKNDYVYQMPGTHNQDGYDISSNGDPNKPRADLNNWTADTGKK